MSGIRKVLAVGAHPDDLELGCGATLAKLTAQGTHVRAVILSRGGRGHDQDYCRESETRRALELLGVRDMVQCDFPDTELHTALNDLIRAIGKQSDEFRPDRVYTMFHQDRHQDHRAAHDASMIACRPVPQILGYETPSSQPAFIPTVWEPVEERFLAAKIAAVRSHISQSHRLYMQEEQVRALAVFRGYQINLGPAEGFIPYRLVSWTQE